MQVQLKTAQANSRPKFLIEFAKPTQDKIVFKKFPTLQKKIKNANHSRHSMTRQINYENGLQGQTTRTTGYNTGLAKLAVQCSAVRQLAEVNQSLVLRINICGKNRHLRQARKLLKGLSTKLTKDFGRGYSVDNLENMRRLYLTYSKSETMSRIS